MFDHNNKHSSQNTPCKCQSSAGIFMTHRQTSIVTAGMLLIIFCGFISGYFSGKRHCVEELSVKFEQDALADQVYASLCTLYNQDADELPSQYPITAQESRGATPCAEPAMPSVTLPHAASTPMPPLLKHTASDNTAPTKEYSYYAELIGFSTQKAADKFAQLLQKKGTPVLVKRRTSKTAKGRKICWFQVVTEHCKDRRTLESLVDRIAREEKLKDTRIVTC